MPAAAEPTLGEVVATCETALAADYEGVEAAACDWFLDPCGICGPEPATRRWCVPAELDEVSRVKRVLDALARTGVAPDVPAGAAVRTALSAAFPCRDAEHAR